MSRVSNATPNPSRSPFRRGWTESTGWPGLGSGPAREAAASPAATTNRSNDSGQGAGRTQIRDASSHQGEVGRAAKCWSVLDLLESIRLRKGFQRGEALNLDLFREDSSHSKDKPLRKGSDLQRVPATTTTLCQRRRCGDPEARLLLLCH